MQKLYSAAAVYTVLGLIAGVFYREFTKANDFVGTTQLSTLHTHYLVLGMLFFLVCLALNAAIDLAGQKLFNAFFICYNVGLLWTTSMMVVKGIWQVTKTDEYPAALSGIAGLGHIIMAAALFLFFRVLLKALKKFEYAKSQASSLA